jgi:hypothetical protein
MVSAIWIEKVDIFQTNPNKQSLKNEVNQWLKLIALVLLAVVGWDALTRTLTPKIPQPNWLQQWM